ncbi:hypothetical protein D3C84_1172070 [compost metagenome]
MVQHTYLNQGQGLDQAVGEHSIGAAWFRAAGGVVVAEDHRSSVVLECFDDDLARVHGGTVDAASEQDVEAEHAVL